MLSARANSEFTQALINVPEEAENRFDSKRGKIVKEIFTSESSYVQSLYILVLVLVHRLFSFMSTETRFSFQNKTPKPPVQSPFNEEEMKLIFSNIDPIYRFNLSLLRDIRERIRTWTPESTIGDIFVQVVRASVILEQTDPCSYCHSATISRFICSIATTTIMRSSVCAL